MSEITRRATFRPAKRRRRPKTFHIETEGAIVNIMVGLIDQFGRRVTKVEIIPDDARRGGDGEGRIWTLEETSGRLVRQLPGCMCHTRAIQVGPQPETCPSCRIVWCARCIEGCPYEYDHEEETSAH